MSRLSVAPSAKCDPAFSYWNIVHANRAIGMNEGGQVLDSSR